MLTHICRLLYRTIVTLKNKVNNSMRNKHFLTKTFLIADPLPCTLSCSSAKGLYCLYFVFFSEFTYQL